MGLQKPNPIAHHRLQLSQFDTGTGLFGSYDNGLEILNLINGFPIV